MKLLKNFPDVALIGTSLIHESGLSTKEDLKVTRYLEKASPMINKEGIRTGAIMTIRDITSLKRLEAALQSDT